MQTGDKRIQSSEESKVPLSRWYFVRQFLLVLIAAGLGLIGGFVSGAGYGGNYAPDFSFLGMPGYEGTSLMAGVVSGGMLLLIAGLSAGLVRRRGVASLTIIGAFMGIALGAPRFFSLIAPSSGLLIVTYVGCASIGAIAGMSFGLLAFQARGGKGAGSQAS